MNPHETFIRFGYLLTWLLTEAYGGAVISPIITGGEKSTEQKQKVPGQNLLEISRVSNLEVAEGSDAVDLTTGLHRLFFKLPQSENNILVGLQSFHTRCDVRQVYKKQRQTFIADDIIKPIASSKHPGLKAFTEITQLWPQGTVPYEIDDALNVDSRSFRIREAMDTIEKHACVKFVPKKSGDQDYVWFFDAGPKRCFSYVGRVGGLQELSVGTGCENQLGVIIHEMMHALGVVHEQSRPDRDHFVQIQWDNIVKEKKPNFYKYSTEELNTFNVPYDYSSLMHYHAAAFTANGSPTILTANKRAQGIIGQRIGLSACDIVKVNRLYGCPPTKEMPLCENSEPDVSPIPTSPTRTPPAPGSTSSPTPQTCEDNYAGCEDIRYDLGACERFPGLYKRLCPKICGVCTEGGDASHCTDSSYYSTLCAKVQSSPQRTATCAEQFLVRAVCPLTCGICSQLKEIDRLSAGIRRSDRTSNEHKRRSLRSTGKLFDINTS